MMFEIKTKEDFDELMLGQKKFNDFIWANQFRKDKYKCVTDQKILINNLIRSGIIPKRTQIISDFNNVLSRTDIFDFTYEDGGTTIKLNEWQEYIANSAIKDFDALLKNEQIHFSDDNGGPLRFACWISRLNSSAIKNFNDVVARSDIKFEKYNNFGYVTLNEFKDKLADGSIKNLDFIIEKNGAIKEDKLGFKDFIKDATNLKYFAPEAFDRIDLNNPEHRELLCIKSNEDSKKFIELMQKMSSNLIKDSNELSINDDIKLNKSEVIYTTSNEIQDNLSNKPIKSSTETENYVQIIQIKKTEKREYTHAIFNKPIENFNDILAREDITFEKSNGSYATFNEFKDKLANGSIKNLDFIIEKNGAIKEDKLKFTDFIKDATNLKYFSPEAFDRIDLNNLEHRSLLAIKPKEEPDKAVFGWNLLGYLSIVFTFGLAYLFGWSQKLFANAIANDWYNGSYIARLQERKKDVEIVVEPVSVKIIDNNSVQNDVRNEQWESKSDGEIIQSHVKRMSKVVNAKGKVDENAKREESITKNNIGMVKTNKEALNDKNKFEHEISDNKQTDCSKDNDKKAIGDPNSKQTKTDQSSQVNKNIELKTKKNIIEHDTDEIKTDNKALNSKNDNKNGFGQKMGDRNKKEKQTKKKTVYTSTKEHDTKKNQTAKNINGVETAKMHVKQDKKNPQNRTEKCKQNSDVTDFLFHFHDATNMNFIFFNDQDAQRQLRDKLVKLNQCKARYNEIFEANKDEFQEYEAKNKIKIVNKIDYFINDAKSELDNRQKKLEELPFKKLYPIEKPDLNKPSLITNELFQKPVQNMVDKNKIDEIKIVDDPFAMLYPTGKPDLNKLLPATDKKSKNQKPKPNCIIIDEEDEID